ncbi:MAG: hypothetical protein VXW65_04180 [Pseudomonadota bacterium]|nr:hypothetical protein [Pseudomonadota bacterium]
MKKTVAVFCVLLLSGCSYKGNPPSGEDIKSAFKTYTNFKTDNLHVEVEECERTNPMCQRQLKTDPFYLVNANLKLTPFDRLG